MCWEDSMIDLPTSEVPSPPSAMQAQVAPPTGPLASLLDDSTPSSSAFGATALVICTSWQKKEDKMYFDSHIKILEALFSNNLNESSKVSPILNRQKSIIIIKTLPVPLNIDEAHLNGWE